VDVFRSDTAARERRDDLQVQALRPVAPQDGGFPGLFRCTVMDVRPAGRYVVFVRYVTDEEVPEELAAYPSSGRLDDDPLQLQGSALVYTVQRRVCDDPATQTANADGDACVCRRGFFDADPQDGELVCEPCAVGTYRDDTDDVTCTPCPSTTSTLHTNSTARADCVCDVGFFRFTDASSSSSSSSSPDECVACGSGSYSAVKGAAACTPCPAGTRSNPGATSLQECTLCPLQTVAPHAGMAECERCGEASPVGSMTSTDDGTACRCNEGYYMNLTRETADMLGRRKTCKRCPARGAACLKDRMVAQVRA